jgi:hypothetical protein
MTFSDTPEGRRATHIQAVYAEGLKRIRSDDNLTPEGKRAQIEAAYKEATSALGVIKQNRTVGRNLKVDALRRDLFGSQTTSDSQTAISFRDAQERVESLGQFDQKKALRLLDQAELSGDTVMVKALIQRAVEHSWSEVASRYAEKRPYHGDKLKELLSLQTPAGIFSSQESMESGFLLNIQKPEELGFG